MLRNYLKIAIRSLVKNTLFSFITIFGLSLSIAVSVRLMTQLKENYDTDHFHPQSERTFRLLTQATTDHKSSLWASVPQPLVWQLRNSQIVEKTVVVRHGGYCNLQTNKGDVSVEITYSEPTFFEVFGFKLLSKNTENALKNPNSVLLSEKVAQKIFGKRNPLGLVIVLEDLGMFTVAGLIKTPPLATHLQIEVLLSLAAAESLEKKGAINMLSQNWQEYKTTAVYAQLNAATSATQLNQTLNGLTRKFEKTSLHFSAQPIEEITPWNPAIENDMHAGTNWSGILTSLFLVAALTVLAAFNYTSLSLARALARAREVGIRKASGAVRSQIIKQFLTESVIVALFSLLMAFPLVEILNEVSPPENEYSFDVYLALGLLVYIILTGVVAGIVPAWLLSSFQPVQVLHKMQNVKLLRGVHIYKFLIVVQFAVTTMLMVFFVVLRDMDSTVKTRLATTLPDHVLIMDLKGKPYETLKIQIEQLSQVERVSATNWLPVQFPSTTCSLKTTNHTHVLRYVSIDHATLEIANIQLLAGRNFPENTPNNSEELVLMNEAAAKLIASKSADVVGKFVAIDSSNVQIIGILPDAAMQELKSIPCIFRYLPKEFNQIAIKTKPNTEQAVMAACQKIWHNNISDKTPNLYNYKQAISHDYSTNSIQNFFGFFCALVMLIACLGILGIAAYAVEVRTKEVGIRKALGANNGQLVWTVSKNFGKLLLWSGIFGIPAGWFCGTLMRNKMGNSVDLGLHNLLLGFGLVFVVGALTVLSQTLRTSQINPAEVLKSD